MKKIIFNVSLILLVLISSCKKESSDQQQTNIPPFSYIKTISVADTLGKILLFNTHYYDSMHRLIKIIEKTGFTNPDTLTTTYTFDYNPYGVVLKRTLSSNSLFLDKTVYSLNAQGLAESSVWIIYPNLTDSIFEDSIKYQYNADGQLLQQTTILTGGSGTIFFHSSNLNVDSVTASPTATNSTQSFFYDGNHLNTIGNYNTGAEFLGKSCKNPLIKARLKSLNLDMANYTYTYDLNNRISTLRISGYSIMPGLSGISAPVITLPEVISYTYY